MKKQISFQFFLKIIAYLRYLPAIIFKIKNWPEFLLSYAGFKEGGGVFKFINGLKIKTNDNVSSATIAVIFIKKDYGEIKDNSVIIDIGANIGVFSLYASNAKNTIVYAFEPFSENYNLLKENIILNNLEKIIIPFNLAVGAKEERKNLYLGDSPFHSFLSVKDSPFNALYQNKEKEENQKYVEVDVVSLKKIFEDNNIKKCDILKIDCEGAEFEILYNLPDEYFKKIKEIRMEYHNHLLNEKNNIEYLIRFLEQKGYKIKKYKKSSNSQGDLWLVQ